MVRGLIVQRTVMEMIEAAVTGMGVGGSKIVQSQCHHGGAHGDLRRLHSMNHPVSLLNGGDQTLGRCAAVPLAADRFHCGLGSPVAAAVTAKAIGDHYAEAASGMLVNPDRVLIAAATAYIGIVSGLKFHRQFLIQRVRSVPLRCSCPAARNAWHRWRCGEPRCPRRWAAPGRRSFPPETGHCRHRHS